jgi:membrane associated rhomboid family serine protease
MLVIPLFRRPGWAGLPWATVLLVLVNVFVFFVLQSGDRAAGQAALRFYSDSGLAALEAPPILAHLRGDGRGELADDLDAMPGPRRDHYLMVYTERDPALAAAVRDRRLVGADHPEHEYWRARRARLQELLDQRFTDRFALRYNAPRPGPALASNFLHGDLGHLAGNMLFLLLLGVLVEGALGAGPFLLLYVLAGLGATGLSLLVNLGGLGAELGASGAIAGLMGAYCVLWGMRKVRVFYWLVVVFGHARVVALWLLPFWLGWELWQALGDSRGVAFYAHAGGIMVGALAAYALRGLGLARTEYLDHEIDSDREASLRTALRAALGQLDYDRARELLVELAELAPDDPGLDEAGYRAWRSTPQAAQFHAHARRLLLVPRRGGRVGASHAALFEDYLAASGGRAQLSAPELLSLARRWIAAGEPAAAERLLERMADRQPALPGLAEAWFVLWLALRDAGQAADARRVAEAILRRFPDSPEAAKLRDGDRPA